jgi:hypothetical protein
LDQALLPDDAQLLKQHLRVKHDEVALLKLMVDKLKLQLARRNRDQFGASSERFEDAQGSLIEPTSLRGWPARYAANSHAKSVHGTAGLAAQLRLRNGHDGQRRVGGRCRGRTAQGRVGSVEGLLHCFGHSRPARRWPADAVGSRSSRHDADIRRAVPAGRYGIAVEATSAGY